MKGRRDPSIDALRGLSVFLMLGANLAPSAAPEPHPLGYRILSTFCAPCFVFLAGTMLGERVPSWSRVLRRSAWLLVFAAALDLGAWGIAPFSGFDVLYAIAASLVALRVVADWSPKYLAALSLVWCLSTGLLVEHFGYRPPTPLLAPPLQAWLFDGWFPLFPWLGVLAFGVAYGRARAEGISEARLLVAGGALTAFSGTLWLLEEPTLLSRGGYAELFYPPTLGVLGVFVGLLPALRGILGLPGVVVRTAALQAYGRRSLLVYALHVLLLGRVFAPPIEGPSWVAFGVRFGALVLVTGAGVGLADRLRLSSRFEPLAMLLGSPAPRE